MRYLFVLLMILVPVSTYASGAYVDYEVEGQMYEGYWISPHQNAPFLLLVHDWDGLTDYEVKRAHMLADLGYAVFAVDLFGKGVRPQETEEKKKLTGALYADRPKMRRLMEGGMAEAKKQGAGIENGAAFGYCFGGAVVLDFARSGADLKGFVSFHGGLKTPDGQDYKQTKGQLLVLHGTADTSVSMEDFADLAVQLEEAAVPHEMISYSGAPHAFTVFGSTRYREDADRKSWNRFTAFLQEILK